MGFIINGWPLVVASVFYLSFFWEGGFGFWFLVFGVGGWEGSAAANRNQIAIKSRTNRSVAMRAGAFLENKPRI